MLVVSGAAPFGAGIFCRYLYLCFITKVKLDRSTHGKVESSKGLAPLIKHRFLFRAFTVRDDLLRVISARDMSRNGRRVLKEL